MELDDAKLVARSQDGDLAAFNGIVERYQTQVYNVAARILGNRTSAEDVAQETFVSAYKAIGRFRGGSLRAWLLRIASNLSIDNLRASRRRPEASLDEALLSSGFQPVSREESPEQRVLANELAGEIQRAILSIPDDQRTVLVLIDVQGMSYEETADSTGVSVGTVKSRLNRARRRVRDHLRQHRELLPERFRHI
ncbi:MAG: sigma-70 family RNA polymerase sigma factor [Chloroflexi bacterium]|nr:sigma-70 family RNA polymerase sigma factor [Chloroflexota bacterium]